MNDPLKRRLTGALVLLLLALGLAFLLPDPDRPRVDQDLRQVTIDLRHPEPSAAPAGEPLTPPSIAAPPPAAPLPQNEVAAAGEEPRIEIEEPLPGHSPAAPPPLSIRPSESLGQESQDRGVAPSPPQAAPPVQLRHSEVLQDLQPPPVQPAPALAALPPQPQPKPQPLPQAKPVPPPSATPKPLPPPVVAAAKPATPPAARPEPPPVKPEPAKPQPPVASPSAPAGKTRWTVQVGSYSEIANARNAEARLKAAGLSTLMSPVDTPKGTLYRVRVGPFGSEAQAQAARSKATQLGFAQATIRKD